MKVPVESLIGSGWDQLLALMTLLAGLAAATSAMVILWLRFRLRAYFVTKPDHMALVEKLADEHASNTQRLVALEQGTDKLATKHSLVNIEQSQSALGQRVVALESAVAGVSQQVSGVRETFSAQIAGVNTGIGRVEHLMTLLLEHALAGEKP